MTVAEMIAKLSQLPKDKVIKVDDYLTFEVYMDLKTGFVHVDATEADEDANICAGCGEQVDEELQLEADFRGLCRYCR